MSDPIDEPNEIDDNVGNYDEEEIKDEENAEGGGDDVDSSEEEEEDDEEEMAKVSVMRNDCYTFIMIY